MSILVEKGVEGALEGALPDFDGYDYGDWIKWFEAREAQGAREPLIYDERPLSAAEASILKNSISQFQLGEVSDGACLIRTLTGYALRTGQDDVITLAHHLVRGSRHHAELLAQFMDHHSLPKVRFHMLDMGFRIIRRLGGAETMLSTLLIAELVATHYYQCLGSSTRSMMLRRIAGRLMEDERAHIELYRKLLADLRGQRTAFHNTIIRWIETSVFVVALLAVWPFHYKVFRRAGTGFMAYWHIYWSRFQAAIVSPMHL